MVLDEGYAWNGGVYRSLSQAAKATKPFKLVAVALANKLARIAFAVIRRDQRHTQRKPFSPAQA